MQDSCSEIARGGTEAHRGSAPTTKGTRELIPGAIGGAMKRHVLRDNEARAKGILYMPLTLTQMLDKW